MTKTTKPKHAVGTLHAKAGGLFLDPDRNEGWIATATEGDDETRVANAVELARRWNCFDAALVALEAVWSQGSRGTTDEGISVSYLVEEALKEMWRAAPGEEGSES